MLKKASWLQTLHDDRTPLKTCSDRLDFVCLFYLYHGRKGDAARWEPSMVRGVNCPGPLVLWEHVLSLFWHEGSLYSRMYQWRAHTGVFCKYRPWESMWGPMKLGSGCSGCLIVEPSHNQPGDSHSDRQIRDFKRLPFHIMLLGVSKWAHHSSVLCQLIWKLGIQTGLARIHILLGRENTVQKKRNTKNKFLSYIISSHTA